MAIIVTPGQVVAAPDWEALFAQHGGSKSNQLRPPTKAEQDAADNTGDDLEQNPIYRYYAADGSYVEARRAPNGDYQIVDYKPSQKYQQTQTPSAQNQVPRDAVPRIEGTPVPGGGFDNESPIKVWRRPDNSIVKTESLDANELKKWQEDRERSRNPGRKTDAEIKAEQEKADREVVDVTYTGTGKNRQKVTTYRSGRKATEAAPQNATAVSVTYDPDGTKVTKWDDGTTTREQQRPGERAAEQRAAEKDTFGVEPAGAPEMTYSVGQMSAGLRTYSQWLSQQVKLHRDTNGAQGIAPNEATKLMERRIALAEAALKEQEGLVNAQSGQRRDDIGQRRDTLSETQSRRGAAERALKQVQDATAPLLKYMLPGDARAFVAAQQEMLQNALGYAGQWGGLRESPEIGADTFPALRQIREASMAGIQTAAAGGPEIFAPRPVTAPAQPPAPTAAATPAFRPQPPATPPPATTAAPVPAGTNPIDGSAVVVPTQLPRPSTVRATTDLTRSLIDNVLQNPAVPADDQRATALPPNPPIVAPFQDEQPADVPVNTDPSQGPVGMAPPMRAIQEARYGQGNYFDPDLAGSELAARLGIDPEIMRQAIGTLYG